MKVAYVVHDLNDAAVARRVQMLRAGGVEVVVMGFHRDPTVPTAVCGAPAISLGETADLRLVQRAGAVLRNLLRPGRLLKASAGAEVIIGRNLEGLAMAARVRRALPRARLVYECLDIHRTLLGRSAAERVIQAIEARLLQAVDLLIVSSPAFLREYFDRRSTLRAPALLLENKVLAITGGAPEARVAPPAPPWVIGWFGNLRCKRTFDELRQLAADGGGRVRVVISGRPTRAILPDFEAAVAAAPYCDYLGPYVAGQLPDLYGRCHFAWAIDYFEEGLNSSWLLPNRLYEASAFGVIPIALGSTETGRWLSGRGAGLVLDDAGQLAGEISRMDAARYAGRRASIAAIPREALVAGQADCDALVERIQAP